MPLPHFPGLGHSMNPIPYPPQLNFPPPPIVAPFLWVFPPPPYSLPPPPTVAPLAPVPSTTWAIAPQAQANVMNVPVPTAQPTVNPAAPTTAPMLMAGGAPDPMPFPPPGSAPGSVMGFDNMSVGGLSTTSILLVQNHAPYQQVPNGGFHLLDLTSLTDTVVYEMWKNTISFFHLSGCTDELIMPIVYQSIKGDMALE